MRVLSEGWAVSSYPALASPRKDAMQQEFVHLEIMIPCKDGKCKLASHNCLDCALSVIRGDFTDIGSNVMLDDKDGPPPHMDVARLRKMFSGVLSGDETWYMTRSRITLGEEE